MKYIKKFETVFALLILVTLSVLAEQHKVLQIFRNGQVIQEYAISDIDYIEVNDKLSVPDQIPDNEIWYVTTDGSVFDLSRNAEYFGTDPFDKKVISNEYHGDHGVVRLDGPLKRINRNVFYGANFREIYLPDCVEYIGNYAISYTEITGFKVPANLKSVGPFGLMNTQLCGFTGSKASKDGKCVIIDGRLYAFASKGMKDYTIPDGVKSIGESSFFRSQELESIIFNEGLESIGADAFAECTSLKSITLPSTLKQMDTYAFRGCSAVEGYYGNERFHTSDNKCLITEGMVGLTIIGFAGKGVSEYAIPEGIVCVEDYAFEGNNDLRSISLPESLTLMGGLAFSGCDNIESVNGFHTTSDHKCFAIDGKLLSFLGVKDVISYKIPHEITKIGYCAFQEKTKLEEIMMDDNVTEIDGYAFAFCPNLKSLTLSASLRSFTGFNPILDSMNIESIYMRVPAPPAYSDKQIRDFPKLKIYVPEQTYDRYMASPQWSDYRQYFIAHHYDDLDIDAYMPDYYTSTDYSQDGMVEKIRTATEGNGIDIVLMGDGFSDRQIADGTYMSVMRKIADTLFTEEPYKSFRNLFNISVVNVVSTAEGYEHGATALGGFFGGGTFVGGNDAECFRYAQDAVPEDRMNEALVVVAMNKDAYAGTCFMYYPTSKTGVPGSGPSIAYFPTNSDSDTFAGLVCHEALGHGFAKLGDEYAYESMGEMPWDVRMQTVMQQEDWGWCMNVDFTSDLSAIRWSKFINDDRYKAENIGAYEGGLTYFSGVWRATENSIMRYNNGGFNAPSREIIYQRINKLAHADWTYDYEDFVRYDAKNRTDEAIRRTKAVKMRDKNLPQLHAPVVVGKTWKEAR